MPGDLYLIRHGDTTLNEKGVFRSHLNPPLNRSGREDADLLAYYFSTLPIDLLLSSPMNRAMETAQAIAHTTGASVHPSRLWTPWHLGEWAGQQSTPLVPAMLRRIQTDEPPPGGEPFSTFRARVTQGLHQAQRDAQHTDGDVVVVTHVRNIRLALDLVADPTAPPEALENIAAPHDPVQPGGVVRLERQADGRWTTHVIALPTEEYAMEQGARGH